jgi:hypothetical protein
MIQNTLHEASMLQRASHFDFHTPQIRRLDQGFEFVGYWFQKRRGQLQVGVKAKRLSEFECRTKVMIALGLPLTEIRRYVYSWCSQFTLANGIRNLGKRVIINAERREQVTDADERELLRQSDFSVLFRRHDAKLRRLLRQYPNIVVLQRAMQGSYHERRLRYISRITELAAAGRWNEFINKWPLS